MSDAFTSTPDLTPFTFVPSDTRVFDPRHARMAHPKTAAERAALLECDDPDEMDREVHGKQSKRHKRMMINQTGPAR